MDSGTRARAVQQVGLDQHARLGIGCGVRCNRPDVECRVRPVALRRVFDGAADAGVAFDQQHVAGAQHLGQPFGPHAGHQRAGAARGQQIGRHAQPQRVERGFHGPAPQRAAAARRCCSASALMRATSCAAGATSWIKSTASPAHTMAVSKSSARWAAKKASAAAGSARASSSSRPCQRAMKALLSERPV